MTPSSNGSPQLPPGPQGRRLRNYYLRMFRYPEFVEGLQEEYGDIVYYELPMNLKCCIVFDADYAQEVLVDQASAFPPWPPGLDEPNKLMEHGCLAVHKGEQHRWRKELMATAFAEDRLDGYARAICGHARKLGERLVGPGRVIDLKPEVERYTLDAVVRTVLGRDVPHEYGLRIGRLVKVGGLLDLIPFGGLVKKLGLTPPTKEMDEAIHAAIRQARDPEHDGSDLISHLVRASEQGLSKWSYDNDRALRDEVIAYMCAFTDAPTAAICLAVHHMARTPAIRDRVEREVADVVGSRQLESSDFTKLPYLQAVFKETLRLEPPPYVMLPKGAEEDRVVGGYLIPKGTLMHVGMRGLHRKAEYWDAAAEFRPERWLEDAGSDGAACPAHAYIPFGSGPHGCSGADLAAMVFVFGVAAIAQRFRLEPTSASPPKKESTGVGVGRFRVAVAQRVREIEGIT